MQFLKDCIGKLHFDSYDCIDVKLNSTLNSNI